MNFSTDFRNRLDTALIALDLDLDTETRNRLLVYLEQLQRWNRTYNLTAVRDPSQMLVQHIFDSLSVIAPLRKELYKKTVNKARIMDIGSGAGLPGVVLAIVHPHWHVECVDAVEKKTAFIRHVAGVLGLSNLVSTHQRVETIAPRQADIVISRAFASLVDFSSLAGIHVANHGYLVAMKGQSPVNEIAELQQHGQWTVEKEEPLSVPELDAQRCLLWLRRQG
ncbi:MAG: 16S rRNA (guanine(527)-N(7))-methyltransferase RsmG [Alcaligenaceae bacterium]|nr:16S rRNA (guanine(527)-N(7))-methyltransferase RsmG [Alcaligenaceae bacterium]